MALFSCLNGFLKRPGCDLDVDRFFYSIRPGLRDVPRYFGKGLTPNRFFRDWERCDLDVDRFSTRSVLD
ncbi:hypothetical protein CEXT_722151 [Caerostris extrusa]|uniref:Uncharacterized protein n=1 Tax=Caerostris extrusa TaxID=172846 RepID=A0AAV4Y5Q0_CAEEX|nr:hypothetical protein CEXT_722151 [Caerostris extrusa]